MSDSRRRAPRERTAASDSKPVDATSDAGVILDPVPLADLHLLARSRVPTHLTGQHIDGALPPAFVAQRALDHIEAGKPARWCSTYYIRDAAGCVVGGCGFKDAPLDLRVEIGYAVAPSRRGAGVATAAVRALAAVAFRSGEVQELLACIDAANGASTRVVQRLGFERGSVEVGSEGERVVHWWLRRP